MSAENVELVREMLAAFIEADEGLVDSGQLSEFFAPDVVSKAHDLPGADMERDGLHGIDEFLEWRAGWIDMFDDWNNSAEKILDAGANRVVATFHQRGKLRGTDDWVEMRYGIVYTVEEGLITEGTGYATQEEALEAAGLEK
jgi:ketosteroid isomerase-like protein